MPMTYQPDEVLARAASYFCRLLDEYDGRDVLPTVIFISKERESTLVTLTEDTVDTAIALLDGGNRPVAFILLENDEDYTPLDMEFFSEPPSVEDQAIMFGLSDSDQVVWWERLYVVRKRLLVIPIAFATRNVQQTIRWEFYSRGCIHIAPSGCDS